MPDRAQLARILFLPLLAILLGLLWARFQPKLPTHGTTAPVPVPTPAVEAAPPQAAPTPLAKDEELVIPARDPFQPPAALQALLKTQANATLSTPEAPPMPPLKVQGIFWGAIPPHAIVNDQILREGDTIQGVRVVKINRTGVTVEYEGTQSTLTMPSPGRPYKGA